MKAQLIPGHPENEIEALIKGWLEYHTKDNPDKDSLFWAFEKMCDVGRHQPEETWPIILRLIAESATEFTLANVAAGPLEDLLCWHGPVFIDRVICEARRDPKFRKCLRAVWGWHSMDKAIRARIDEAVRNVEPW